MEKQFHGPPFAGPRKGWIFVFLPWGIPQVGNRPLGAACGSTLLRPAAAACCFCCSSPPAQNSESVLATTISLMASSSFISFPSIASDLQQSTLFRLLCMTGHSWRTVEPLWYECLIQWQQNGSKAMMWQLYKIPAIRVCTRRKTFLLDWQLSVACLYPTTPTDYPSTTRGMCVWAL